MTAEEKAPIPVAVALQYEHGSSTAPTVVAKGRGVVAEKIIEIAKEHGIHIDGNPMLAEALSNVEVDDHIPVELYKAVAEIIGFVLQTARKAKTGVR